MEPVTAITATAIGIAVGKKTVEAAIDILKEPSKEFASKVLGASAKGISEIVELWFGVRKRNYLDTLVRAEMKLKQAGIEPSPVPLKIISPLLENASLEEDEEMRDIWANMLATAANPETLGDVHPSFPSILKDFSAREVKFLDVLVPPPRGIEVFEELFYLYEDLELVYVKARLGVLQASDLLSADELKVSKLAYRDLVSLNLMLNVWSRCALILRSDRSAPIGFDAIPSEVTRDVAWRNREVEVKTTTLYLVTELAKAFVCACRAPKVKP